MPCRSPQKRLTRRIDPEFKKLLRQFDLNRLDDQDATIYGIDRDLKIRYVNAGWMRFAHENKAPEALTESRKIIGASVLDFMVGPLRQYYHSLFCHIFGIGAPRVFEYECSSPDELRFFHMDLLPLIPDKTAENPYPQGLLIINSLSRPAEPIEEHRNPQAPCDEDYLTEHEMLISCSNCRRFRRRGRENSWDWVPSYLEDPPAAISHSLCPVCLDYYYPAPELSIADEDDVTQD